MSIIQFTIRLAWSIAIAVVAGAILVILHVFDFNPERRLAFAVLGVIADPKALEALQWFAVAAVAVVSAGLYNFIAWRLSKREPPSVGADVFIFTWHYRPEDMDKVPIRRLIPLPDAARIAYEKLRGRTLKSQKLPAMAADMKHGDTARPISWFGIALLGGGAIPLFGRHPPSTILEIVPRGLVKASGHLSNDANSIAQYGGKQPEFEGLFIKKADFQKRLEEIKSWHGDDT